MARTTKVRGDSRLAKVLLETQAEAATTLSASQAAVADLLGSHNTEDAALLLEAQEEAALSLLASQRLVAELLSAHDLEVAETLLEAQEEAAATLLASQSAAAGLLGSQNVPGQATLLGTRDEAARTLLASQVALAKLLRSRNVRSAATLRAAQGNASKILLAALSQVATLLRERNTEGAGALLEAQSEEARALLASQAAIALLLLSRDVQDATAAVANAELEERVSERTQELTRANTRLAAATLAKSDFLASMSHELRTPLNAIIGFSGLLMVGKVGELEPEQKKQIEIINASGRHLLELVDSVLDLSAVEAGRVKIEREPLNVSLAVGDVVRSLASMAEEKGLDLSFEVSADAGTVVTDRLRLDQILLNVVGNAIKFTDAGSVRVDVTRDVDEIVFVVTDSGRGIPDGEIQLVFDAFYQVDRPDIAKSDGVGVGLAVSTQLAQLLGGTLSVASQGGVGTAFTLRLPSQ